MQECYDPLFYVDMPATKGAVYIENCEGDFQCILPISSNDLNDALAAGIDLESTLNTFIEEH